MSQVFTFNLSTTSHPSTTFNLDDLKKHDAIEFDGSLSRNDDFFGDDLTFNFGIWATVAERLGLYESRHSHADKFVSIETAAKARAARVEDAKRVNPTFNASQNQITGSPGTTALYLLTLWDDEAEAAPKDWVRPWFGTSNLRSSLSERALLTMKQKRSVFRMRRDTRSLTSREIRIF